MIVGMVTGNSTYPTNAYSDPYSSSRSPPLANTYANTSNQTGYYNNTASPYGTTPYAQTTSPPALGPPSGNAAATSAAAAALGASSYYTPHTTSPPPASQPQSRAYTLGGGGYGDNVVPELSTSSALYGGPSASTSQPSPLNTSVPSSSAYTSPTRSTAPAGPRQPAQPQSNFVLHGSPTNEYEDSPPVYDEGLAQPAGQWNSKR